MSEVVCVGKEVDGSDVVIRRREAGEKLVLEYVKIINGEEYVTEIVLDKERQRLYGGWFDCDLTPDEVVKAESIIRSIKSLDDYDLADTSKLPSICHRAWISKYGYEILPTDTVEKVFYKTKEEDYFAYVKISKDEAEKMKFSKPIDGILVACLDVCYDICYYEWRLYDENMKLHEVIEVEEDITHKILLGELLKLLRERKQVSV